VHGSDGPIVGCPLEDAVESKKAVERELYDDERGRWVMSAAYPMQLKSDEGRDLYLHFTRDITREKEAALALELSVEHHKALGQLLQRLRDCNAPEESLDALLDLTFQLSWMKEARGAGAFLARGTELQLVTWRHLDASVAKSCARVPMGECLCGMAATTKKSLVHTPVCTGHSRLAARGAPHGHVTLPVVYEGKTLGVVNFYLASGHDLSPPQVAFLEAAIGATAAALAEQMARQAAREAQAKASRLERELLERTLASQEEERKRVARELHDDLGQALSALLLDVESAGQENSANLEFCTKMELSVRDLIAKVYQLAWDLRPALLDDFGLDSALSRHIDKITKRTDLAIDYQFVSSESSRLPSSVEIVLYRITQEALNNVVRHANASRVSVIVFRRPDTVTVMIEDDGCGFDADAELPPGEHAGLGISGMRERVALLKGTLVIESSPGNGTSLKATVPVAQ
jgi:signal transduction histidine kinase